MGCSLSCPVPIPILHCSLGNKMRGPFLAIICALQLESGGPSLCTIHSFLR